MANYYTDFSFRVENVTQEEMAWALQEYEKGDLIDEGADYDGYYFGLKERGDALWFSSEDGGGDVNSLADFLEKFINQFRPDEVIWFEYAFTCDQLRVGAFGGGCVVIGKEGQHWMDIGAWAADKEESIKEGRQQPG